MLRTVRPPNIGEVSRSLRTDPRPRQALRRATRSSGCGFAIMRRGLDSRTRQPDETFVRYWTPSEPGRGTACASSSCDRPRTSTPDQSSTAGPEHRAKSSSTNNEHTKPQRCGTSCGLTSCCTSLDIMCSNIAPGRSTAYNAHRDMNGSPKRSLPAGSRPSRPRFPGATCPISASAHAHRPNPYT